MAGAQEEVRMHTVCIVCRREGPQGFCGREATDSTAPVRTWNIVSTQEKGTVFVFKQLFYFLAQGDR